MSSKYEFKGTKGPWHPVEYAGFWKIQDKPFYGEADMLSYDEVLSAAMELPCIHENKAKANAYLMAAAPYLLEACKEAIKELEFHNWQNTATYNKIVSAIHKSLNIEQ